MQQLSGSAAREMDTRVTKPSWTRTTDRMDRHTLWHPSGDAEDSGKEPGLSQAFGWMGLIEN